MTLDRSQVKTPMFQSIDTKRLSSVFKTALTRSVDDLKMQRLKRQLDEIRGIADALPGPMKALVGKQINAIEKLAESGNVDAALSCADTLLASLRHAKSDHEVKQALTQTDHQLSRIEGQSRIDGGAREAATLEERNRQEAHRVLGVDRLQLSMTAQAPHPSQGG